MNNLKVSILDDLSEVSQKKWDLCACPEVNIGGRPLDPFTTYRFLRALEKSNSVGKDSGWLPKHCIIYNKNEMVGSAPLYLKQHSQGEYIFDHNWAQAYNQAGGSYYPKLQGSVPFTPVTGRRFLSIPGFEDSIQPALMASLTELAIKNNISSIHFTFCSKKESLVKTGHNFQVRETVQYHWHNKNYSTFSEFLETLSSRKRKAIKKERETAKSFGGKIECFTGKDITDAHWDSFWEFYQDTGRRKWGTPYLTRNFFDILQQEMRDDLLLILAIRDGKPIAGALNFIGRETLFGRYWGASESHSCLHYELCYYQAIDYAIRNKMKSVEAGAQGDHKLSRGYLPRTTFSLHWFNNQQFNSAIENYLTEEKYYTRKHISNLMETSPYKKMETK